MGHDIDLVDATGHNVTRTYITGNFTGYSHEVGGIHAMHGHTSETVVKIAQAAIDAMAERGFEEPAYEGGNWG